MFKDDNGKVSFIRVACFVALMLGVGIGVCGIIGFLMAIPDAIAVIASSQALIALILGAKAWQKMSE